jgi:hypothetical protein
MYELFPRRQNLTSKDDEIHRLESLVRELRCGGGEPSFNSHGDDTKTVAAENARVDAQQQTAVISERVRALENQLQDNSHRYSIHNFSLKLLNICCCTTHQHVAYCQLFVGSPSRFPLSSWNWHKKMPKSLSYSIPMRKSIDAMLCCRLRG